MCVAGSGSGEGVCEKRDLEKSVERGETYPGRNTIVPKLNPFPRRQSR